jgi:replication factor C subunit 3/5
MEHFPNLLFYGPPGTGKTTSIINLIKSYQDKGNRKNLMIHLNASDERGIDIIRNQINSFVNSKSLFNDGMKFVILDEVDYMTKNAQIALRYLLQDYKSNVRFCLICNYISRIDEALQNEFVRLRFNQLPENEIIHFLNIINEKENLNYNTDTIHLIQKLFNSDIRSMINYMQSNEQIIHNKKIIQTDLWDNITTNMKDKSLKYNIEFITNVSNEYNVEKKNIIKNYLNYIIRYNKELLSSEFLQFVENIMHVTELNIDYMLPLTILKMKTFITN